MATIEIESYYDRVRAALAWLAPEMRDDLLEDLPDHLAEVLAEGEGSLRDRLGEPEAYADELRSAAGVEAAVVPTARGVHSVLERGLRRATDLARRFDVQAGRLVGYPRLMDLLRAVGPGWWVLRGWIVAQFICGTRDRATWHGFIPTIGGNPLAGFLCTVAVVAVSVGFARRSSGFTGWPRRAMAAANTAIAAWAIFVLAASVGGTAYAYGGSADGSISPYSPGTDISNIYVYDKNGSAVVGARLFDQNGNPIQLGSPYCENGNIAGEIGPDGSAAAWTYPLCPTRAGPFRSGPGPLPAKGTAPASAAPSSSPAASPRNASTAKSSAKASPTR